MGSASVISGPVGVALRLSQPCPNLGVTLGVIVSGHSTDSVRRRCWPILRSARLTTARGTLGNEMLFKNILYF